jgi:hypothetical protein
MTFILGFKMNRNKNMVREYKYLPMETYTSESMNKGLLKDMGSITGIVEPSIEVSF